MIKVAMITRSTLYTSRGGDTIQAQQTARMLGFQGIAVDIKLSGEQINYNKYALLHFFNITRPADILYHIRKAAKPFVVSTILIDYSEYDKYHRKGLSGLALRHCTIDSIEYVKSLARWLSGKDKLMSISYLWKGQKRSITEIINKAAVLFPNSNSEYKRLTARYDCKARCSVVPNGIDPGLFRFNAQVEKDATLVLCVARIEGIKNQLNLIKALNNTGFQLLIIGDRSPNQERYYESCRKIAAKNIHFMDHIPQEKLVAYYEKAKVHVLPSWFETTGLSSLEGAAMGCNIVITDKGYTRDYFGDNAIYCDPSSIESIYSAVKKAALMPGNEKLRTKIDAQYTWQQAGICTAKGYKSIINKLWD
jgi:glycosyltransferase involved in cell wall biosynthesis